MCADFLETNYDRVSLRVSISKWQTLKFMILESLSLNIIIVPNLLTIYMPSGFYRIRKAPAFWQLCHQTSVFEGSEMIIWTLEQNKCICHQFKAKNSLGWAQCSATIIFLQLLGELLLDRHNFTVMTKYISRAENLKLMMNLLRDNSRNIQFEAFHVFKVWCMEVMSLPSDQSTCCLLILEQGRVFRLITNLSCLLGYFALILIIRYDTTLLIPHRGWLQ